MISPIGPYPEGLKRGSQEERIDEQDGFLETIRMHAVILLISW